MDAKEAAQILGAIPVEFHELERDALDLAIAALEREAKIQALAHRAAALIALRREADGKGYASGVEMELAKMAPEVT